MTTSEILPTKIVATVVTNAGTHIVHEISTRHTSAIGIPVTHPFVVTNTISSLRPAFASLHEAIDWSLGDRKRPLPTFSDLDLVDAILVNCSVRGDLDSIGAINDIITALVGTGQLHLCEFDHLQPGEQPLESEHVVCSFCQFEDGELADAIHNARTEVIDDANAGFDDRDYGALD